jgi:hypothetical protein
MSCPQAPHGARRVPVAEDHVLLAGRIADDEIRAARRLRDTRR